LLKKWKKKTPIGNWDHNINMLFFFFFLFLKKKKKKIGGGEGKKKTPIGNWDHNINIFILFFYFILFYFENNAKHMDYDVLLGFLELPKLWCGETTKSCIKQERKSRGRRAPTICSPTTKFGPFFPLYKKSLAHLGQVLEDGAKGGRKLERGVGAWPLSSTL